MFTVAASPGVDQRRCWQQIPFVVVARTVGQHEVLHRVDAAADPRDEVVGLRCPVEWCTAVKAAPGLQAGQALAQRLGQGQSVPPEQVTVQVLLFGGDAVDLRRPSWSSAARPAGGSVRPAARVGRRRQGAAVPGARRDHRGAVDAGRMTPAVPQPMSYRNGNACSAEPTVCKRGRGCSATATSTRSSICAYCAYQPLAGQAQRGAAGRLGRPPELQHRLGDRRAWQRDLPQFDHDSAHAGRRITCGQ